MTLHNNVCKILSIGGAINAEKHLSRCFNLMLEIYCYSLEELTNLYDWKNVLSCAERSCMLCGSLRSSSPYTYWPHYMCWLWPSHLQQQCIGLLEICFSITPMHFLSFQDHPSGTWLSFWCSSIRHELCEL